MFCCLAFSCAPLHWDMHTRTHTHTYCTRTRTRTRPLPGLSGSPRAVVSAFLAPPPFPTPGASPETPYSLAPGDGASGGIGPSGALIIRPPGEASPPGATTLPQAPPRPPRAPTFCRAQPNRFPGVADRLDWPPEVGIVVGPHAAISAQRHASDLLIGCREM
jgi:hypothetical protein